MSDEDLRYLFDHALLTGDDLNWARYVYALIDMGQDPASLYDIFNNVLMKALPNRRPLSINSANYMYASEYSRPPTFLPPSFPDVYLMRARPDRKIDYSGLLWVHNRIAVEIIIDLRCLREELYLSDPIERVYINVVPSHPRIAAMQEMRIAWRAVGVLLNGDYSKVTTNWLN